MQQPWFSHLWYKTFKLGSVWPRYGYLKMLSNISKQSTRIYFVERDCLHWIGFVYGYLIVLSIGLISVFRDKRELNISEREIGNYARHNVLGSINVFLGSIKQIVKAPITSWRKVIKVQILYERISHERWKSRKSSYKTNKMWTMWCFRCVTKSYSCKIL